MREEEIATLRGECKSISAKMIDVEEQNQGLREENALAFTKVYKKLESSSTPEGTCSTARSAILCFSLRPNSVPGLQTEMMSLKEGTDNRMLVLESLMREIGGDKMKGMVQDVANLQNDNVALWKENARMVTALAPR